MNIVIDVVLLAIIILAVVLSAKKGIIVTIAELVAFALAILCASFTAKPIANVMYTSFFHKSVEKGIYEAMPLNKTNYSAKEKAQLVFDNMPDFAKNQAEKVGINVSTIQAQLGKIKLDTDKDLYVALEDQVVKPIAVSVLSHIVYFFTAIIYGIILRFIAMSAAKTFKKSETIEKSDMVIGGLIGIIKGAVIFFLIFNLLKFIQPTIENDGIKQAIPKSIFVQNFEKLDPLDAVSLVNAFKNE